MNGGVFTKRKDVILRRVMLWVVLLGMAVLCLAAETFAGNYKLFEPEVEDFDWSEAWQDANGETPEFPCRLDDTDGVVTLQKTLPQTLPEDTILVISSDYRPLRATVEGTELKVSGSFMPGLLGNTYANPLGIVSIPTDLRGKQLTLELYANGSKPRTEVHSIVLGSRAAVYSGYVGQNTIIDIVVMLMLVLGIVIFVVELILRFRRLSVGASANMYAALFIMFSSIWVYVDRPGNAFLYADSGAFLFVTLFAFLLIGPMFLRLLNVCNVGRELVKWLYYSFLGYSCAVLLTICFGIFDLSLSLMHSHFLFGITMLLCTLCLGIDRFVRKNESAGYMFWSMVALMPTGMLTMFNFYWRRTPDNASYFRYGIAIYAMILGIHTIKEILEKYAELSNIQKLRYAAEHDPLTDIFNRFAFCNKTKELLDIHPNTQYVIGCLDVEKFRLINDTFGREEGDKLLRHITKLLKKCVTAGGLYGRIDADRFSVCIKNTPGCTETFIDTIQEDLANYPLDYSVIPSFGWYIVTDNKLTVEAMLDRASLARQTVKGSFIARSAFFDEVLRQKQLNEQSIVNQLDGAIANGEFQIVLQPKYDLSTGIISGAEALVRWNHPSRGVILPGSFIPVLERNGLIMKLDTYILEQVCIVMKNWICELGEDRMLPISINVSRVHLCTSDLAEKITEIASRYAIPPRLLNIEITESAYSEMPELFAKLADELHANGFYVHMDDFGSGYSSLNMIRDVEVDELKLDMRFLYGSSERGKAIIKAVIDMANALGISVLAEGVEDDAQVDLLRSVGCQSAQGFFFCRPISTEEMKHVLTTVL